VGLVKVGPTVVAAVAAVAATAAAVAGGTAAEAAAVVVVAVVGAAAHLPAVRVGVVMVWEVAVAWAEGLEEVVATAAMEVGGG
jgi:hypothetical protein